MRERNPFPQMAEIKYRNLVNKQIREWKRIQKLSNEDIVARLENEGYSISPGELSRKMSVLSEEIPNHSNEKEREEYAKKFRYQFTAAQYALVKKAIEPKKNTSRIDKELCIDINGEVPLVVNTNETYFKGYLGKYFVCYYSTKSGEQNIIKGKLVLEPDADDNSCNALLTVDGDPKEYTGKWVILAKQSICYCILHGRQSGELCMMVFDCLPLNTQEITVLLGVAATVSAGATRRRPTIHRMCICREDPTAKHMEIIAAQLKLNKRDILIRQDCIDRWLEDHSDLQWLRPLIEREENASLYYKFSEKELKAKITREKKENISIKEMDEIICLLRGISEAANNNKISITANEALERLMKDEGD